MWQMKKCPKRAEDSEIEDEKKEEKNATCKHQTHTVSPSNKKEMNGNMLRIVGSAKTLTFEYE